MITSPRFWRLSLWLLVCASASNAPGQDYKVELERGRAELDEGRYEEAAQVFSSAARQSKDDSGIADLRFHEGIARFRAAESLKAKEAARAKQQFQAAKEAFELARQLNPRNAGLLNNLGLVAAELGDVDSARKDLLEAIKLASNTNKIAYVVNYADLLCQLNSFDKALMIYLEVLKMEPSSDRVRGAVIDIALGPNQKQIDAIAWKLYESGQLDFATELSLRGLTTQQEDSTAVSLITCCARSLAKQYYRNDRLPHRELMQPLVEHRTVGEGISGIIELHSGGPSGRASFAWWSRQVDASGKSLAPPHGWPQAAFCELIRARGQVCESLEKDLTDAEAYYRLAYELTPAYLDPVALIKLADLWMKQGRKGQLEAFLANEERRIFSEKGEAILRQNMRRTYEIHRALASIYVHVGRWSASSVGGADGAEFQLRAALADAEAFNMAAKKAGKSERIVDAQLVETLARHYESSDRTRQAFELRVAHARDYFEAGRGVEATRVFEPIYKATAPEGVSRELGQIHATLSEQWKKMGGEGLVPPPNKGTKLDVRDHGGRAWQVFLDDRTRFDVSELQKVRELMAEVLSPPDHASGGQPESSEESDGLHLLITHVGPDSLRQLHISGNTGSIELNRDGKPVSFPFHLEGKPATGGAKSIMVLRP